MYSNDSPTIFIKTILCQIIFHISGSYFNPLPRGDDILELKEKSTLEDPKNPKLSRSMHTYALSKSLLQSQLLKV